MDKSFRKNIVKKIVTKMDNFKIKNGGSMSYGELNKHLAHVKHICPTISRSTMYSVV